MLYKAYQAQCALLAPTRAAAGATVDALRFTPPVVTRTRSVRKLSAFNSVLASARLTHDRPPFGIHEIMIDGEPVAVSERAVLSTPFATLVHFEKQTPTKGPAVLLVAALSGHFATMLRATARALLQDHDVYITDWHNARDVPASDGRFGYEEYTEHVVKFLRFIGPGAHLMAVCQPCGPALIAASVLAQADDPVQPLSLTLMSGPIDARVNPTKINLMADRRSVDWYRKHCIATVPRGLAGAGRRVYPGFLQVSAFMSMNARRHLDSHLQMYRNLAIGEFAAAQTTKDFYGEYFAVLDIAEEFYLETITTVFQEHLLARGQMQYQGRAVEPAAIRRTALLTVEAELDDMCAVGQTSAAHTLVTGLREEQRGRYIQPGVGHYGIFAGRRWDSEVYPVVRDFIAAQG
jgi:poly(3-hydroxybutyrate) depolymerase